MKKKTVSRKLLIHRDTIARLEKAVPAPRGGGATVDQEIGFMSSCGYECGCSPTGDSVEVVCIPQ